MKNNKTNNNRLFQKLRSFFSTRNTFVVLNKVLIIFMILFVIASASVSSATVSHQAEQVRPGIFGLIYAGIWSFMNGNVGIGTTAPNSTLTVNGIMQTLPRATATCDAYTEGGIYYDSDDKHFYGCNSTSWIKLDTTYS